MTLLFIAFFGSANGQETYSDINGIPLKDKKANIVEGSEYMSDNWVNGYVKFKNGKVANNIKLKFNQLSGELVFKNVNDQEFTFVSEVAEFGIPYSVADVSYSGIFRSGFQGAKGINDHTFLEVLNDGNIKLLKLTSKSILQTKPFYSGTSESNIVQTSKYYLFKDGALIPIKKEASDILNVLESRERLTTYIKENKLKLKDDKDLIRLFSYYNSL
jgi:hypothetical protein